MTDMKKWIGVINEATDRFQTDYGSERDWRSGPGEEPGSVRSPSSDESDYGPGNSYTITLNGREVGRLPGIPGRSESVTKDEYRKYLRHFADKGKWDVLVSGQKPTHKMINTLISQALSSEHLAEDLGSFKAAGIPAEFSSALLRSVKINKDVKINSIKDVPKTSDFNSGIVINVLPNGDVIAVLRALNYGHRYFYRRLTLINGEYKSSYAKSLKDAIKGMSKRGKFFQINQRWWSEVDRDNKPATDPESVLDRTTGDPMRGSAENIYTYMNEKYMPRMRKQMEDMVDNIYSNLRQLSNKPGGYGYKQQSEQQQALEKAAAIDAIAKQGFTRDTMELFLRTMDRLHLGFASVPRNEAELADILKKEPLARAKWAKVVLHAAKKYHDEFIEMMAEPVMNALRGERATEVAEDKIKSEVDANRAMAQSKFKVVVTCSKPKDKSRFEQTLEIAAKDAAYAKLEAKKQCSSKGYTVHSVHVNESREMSKGKPAAAGVAEDSKEKDPVWNKGTPMPKDYTCHCGLYVHPSRRNPKAIHISDCPYAPKQDKEQGVAEGYILKKTNVEKTFEPGDPDAYYTSGGADVTTKHTDYEIINNKTGKVVGTASWTTNDYFGPGALKITMKNGATRWLDIWEREKGNPQTAFNRFVKDPKTAKKYKDQDVAEGSAEEDKDTVFFEVNSENAYNAIMKRFGSVIDWDGDAMVVSRKHWPAVQEVAYDAGGEATEYNMENVAEGVKSQKEKVTEEWSVLYDAEHAKNLRARVRMQEGSTEETVREWFTRTFQPLSITELRKNETLEENPLAALGATAARIAPVIAGAVTKVGSNLAGLAKSGSKPATSPGSEQALAAALTDVLAKTGKETVGQNKTALSAAQRIPNLPSGAIAVIPPTPTKPGVVKGPSGTTVIPKGATNQNSVTNAGIAKEEQDRETRTGSDDIKNILNSAHKILGGDYDYDRQLDVLHDLAKKKNLDYYDVLKAWVRDEDGFAKAIKSIDSQDSQPA